MDNQSGSECPRRRRLRYTASLFYFIYGCCFEREEDFFFEFRRRVNAREKRGKKNKKRRRVRGAVRTWWTHDRAHPLV